MNASIQIDNRQFKQALQEVYHHTTRTLPEVINQSGFNVTGRTIDSMKPAPGEEQATRSRIKAYMDMPVDAPKLRIATSGPRRGQFIRVGNLRNRLTRKILILQKRRGKKGLPGFYGSEMREQSTRFSTRSQVAVGFLKSAFVPVIKGLNHLVKFRNIKTRWGRISVWPGSAGSGRVTPAREGWSPKLDMEMKWKVPGSPSHADPKVRPNLQAAFNAEGAEMMRHLREKMQKVADKVNAR